MQKTLFLLCPTDCLETVIDTKFVSENYFYTSLGNSFASDNNTMHKLKELIVKRNITYIYFVLSCDNQIILDAMEGQYFSNVSGLKKLYQEVGLQKQNSQLMWLTKNRNDLIVSYFLNHKIRELQLNFNYLTNQSIKIDGKIYNKVTNSFKNIYHSLTYLDKHILN